MRKLEPYERRIGILKLLQGKAMRIDEIAEHFYDEILTSAIIDRLVHHSHLLIFQGQSSRLTYSSMKSQ